MELPSVGMIKLFVAAGLGVSLISESFARDEVRDRPGEADSDFGYGSVARAGLRLPARPNASAFGGGVRFAGSPGCGCEACVTQ